MKSATIDAQTVLAEVKDHVQAVLPTPRSATVFAAAATDTTLIHLATTVINAINIVEIAQAVIQTTV